MRNIKNIYINGCSTQVIIYQVVGKLNKEDFNSTNYKPKEFFKSASKHGRCDYFQPSTHLWKSSGGGNSFVYKRLPHITFDLKNSFTVEST